MKISYFHCFISDKAHQNDRSHAVVIISPIFIGPLKFDLKRYKKLPLRTMVALKLLGKKALNYRSQHAMDISIIKLYQKITTAPQLNEFVIEMYLLSPS